MQFLKGLLWHKIFDSCRQGLPDATFIMSDKICILVIEREFRFLEIKIFITWSSALNSPYENILKMKQKEKHWTLLADFNVILLPSLHLECGSTLAHPLKNQVCQPSLSNGNLTLISFLIPRLVRPLSWWHPSESQSALWEFLSLDS